MIKIFDFIYYFMYQLNRRGYKTANYDNARFAVAFVVFALILPLKKIIQNLPNFNFEKDYFNFSWNLFSILFALVTTYPLTKKFYGHNGTRKWVIAHFDKTTTIKKQNSIVLVIMLVLVLCTYFFLCFKLGDFLKE